MDHKLLRSLCDLVFLSLFSLGGGEFQQSCIREIRVCHLAMVSVVWLECQIDTELLLPRFAFGSNAHKSVMLQPDRLSTFVFC